MSKQILIIASLAVFICSVSFAQEKHIMKMESKKCCMNMEEMKSDSSMHNMNHKMECKKDCMNMGEMKSNSSMHNMNHKMGSKQMDKKSIIHEGVIDLKSIDKNNDGMVYQDQMCWNVISDEAGDCPKCGMKLKKVSLNEAKENLTKHNFKVK